MPDYFIHQQLTIEAKTGCDLSTATVKRILYRKPPPDNTTGFWTAVLSNGQSLAYDTAINDIAITGQWQFQAYIENGGGKKGYGQFFYITFITPIS